MHTKKELFDKLLKKGYQKDVIKKAIDKLEEYHYVDDRLFSKHFITENKRYSKRMLENKLREKGINAEIIGNSIDEFMADDEEYNLCLKQAEKYVKNKDMLQEGAYQKLLASLARKGFDFNIIKQVCKRVLSNEDADKIDDLE